MTSQSNSILNDLLNRLSCSLLQYMGEAWPWVAGSDGVRLSRLVELIERQKLDAERIAGLLTQRRAVIQTANYPWDGSRWNYVTVDYMKPNLIADEDGIVSQLESAVSALSTDTEAVRLLQQIAADEKLAREKLQAL